MNKLYCITSHCNTLKKVKSLKRTIKQLNDLNRDILLISHIPLSEDIIESVNYFIYDGSNPILLHYQIMDLQLLTNIQELLLSVII